MILVTGARGYIGSCLMQQLSQRMMLAYPFEGDVSSVEQWAVNMKIYRPSCIIHLAAKTNLRECESDPLSSFSNNYWSAVLAAKSARVADVPFVFVSTITDTRFDTVYELDKRAACLAIKSMRLKQYAILKLATVYGCSLAETKSGRGIINHWVSEGKAGRPVVVYREVMDKRRDFVHVSDVVNRIVQGIDAKSGYYDVCTGRSRTMLDAAQYIAQETGSHMIFEDAPAPLYPVEKRDETIIRPRWINGDCLWTSFEDGIGGML